MEDELKRAQAQIARLERRLREEVAAVHKQYRRDLVLYRETDSSPVPTRRRSAWTSTS
jgi:hypothetical protein